MLNAESLAAILAPLLVNRQFYAEAVSIFYRINYFHFPSVGEFNKMMTVRCLVRLPYFAHVSFGWRSSELQYGGPTYKHLSTMTALRRLDIEVDEKEWRDTRRRLQQRKKDGAQAFGSKIDLAEPQNELDLRIKGLLRCKADEVHFHGTCPTVERVFKPAMIRPKQAEIATPASRKRKAVDGEPIKAKRAKKT